MQLGWPRSSSWWQWVQVSPASPCATDLKVRFAQCWGDPKLQSNQSDGRTGPTFLHPRAVVYLGMGQAAEGVLPTQYALLPPLNWVLLTQQETVSWHWLCHSTICKNMLYYTKTVAELGKGVANSDKVQLNTRYSEKESSSSCWRTPEMIHPAYGCDKNRQIRHWYGLPGG